MSNKKLQYITGVKSGRSRGRAIRSTYTRSVKSAAGDVLAVEGVLAPVIETVLDSMNKASVVESIDSMMRNTAYLDSLNKYDGRLEDDLERVADTLVSAQVALQTCLSNLRAASKEAMRDIESQ